MIICVMITKQTYQQRRMKSTEAVDFGWTEPVYDTIDPDYEVIVGAEKEAKLTFSFNDAYNL